MPCGHRPQRPPQGCHRHETRAPATHIAKGNGLASNGLKIALWHKRQKPAQWQARAGKAYPIGKEKGRAMAALCRFDYVALIR
jgi:hypothetical protein